MRLLIVSDLHANLAALDRAADTPDAVVFLGDPVDHGPRVERLRHLPLERSGTAGLVRILRTGATRGRAPAAAAPAAAVETAP